MIFFDTSVYVAAFTRLHERHTACMSLLEELLANGRPMSCSIHGLCELYSVLTRTPPPRRLNPATAMSIVERIRENTQVFTLTVEEQMDVIRDAARQHLVSGIVYDAAILACARKAKAEVIYTLNIRHFKLAAPDLAGIIQEP
jgi:predicted nucleic acid-binding protein